jgi:hypothetical protein
MTLGEDRVYDGTPIRQRRAEKLDGRALSRQSTATIGWFREQLSQNNFVLLS